MAKKKPRTPTPPRVKAPQQRTGRRNQKVSAPPPDDMGDRARKVLYGVSALGFLGLVVAIALIALGGGGTSSAAVAKDMTAAGCTFKSVKAYVPPGQGTHVNSLTKKFPWNTSPPSNGQHYPEWAVWGFYTDAVNPRQVVHNEEHGGVIVWWGSEVSPATVDQLRAWYDEQPIGSFGTPYPSLGSKVAITAWTGDVTSYQHNGYYGEGHIATCASYTAATKKAFETFRKAYRGHGPEGIPLCADHPGDSPNKSSC